MSKPYAELHYGFVDGEDIVTFTDTPNTIANLAATMANVLFNRGLDGDKRAPYDATHFDLEVDKAIFTRVEEGGYYVEVKLFNFHERICADWFDI